MLPDGLVWDEELRRTTFVWGAREEDDGSVAFNWARLGPDWFQRIGCSTANSAADLGRLKPLPSSLYTYGRGPYSPHVRAVMEDTFLMVSAQQVAEYLTGYSQHRLDRLLLAAWSLGLDFLYRRVENDYLYWMVERAMRVTQVWSL